MIVGKFEQMDVMQLFKAFKLPYQSHNILLGILGAITRHEIQFVHKIV